MNHDPMILNAESHHQHERKVFPMNNEISTRKEKHNQFIILMAKLNLESFRLCQIKVGDCSP